MKDFWVNAYEQVLGVSSGTFQTISERLNLEKGPLLALDILIVLGLIYIAYRLIQGTRAFRILIGLFLIELLMIGARIVNLQILNWLLSKLFVVFLFAIPVIFQPELRRVLGKIGERGLPQSYLKRNQVRLQTDEILTAVRRLKSQRVGALIVIKGISGLDEFIETGTRIDAVVSASLMEAIFQRASPLHDGAVIIDGDRIIAAGCVYNAPVPEEISGNFGLRHRAAAGFSLESDASVIVVSEERGSVSLVRDGVIKQLGLRALEKALREPLTFERTTKATRERRKATRG